VSRVPAFASTRRQKNIRITSIDIQRKKRNSPFSGTAGLLSSAAETFLTLRPLTGPGIPALGERFPMLLARPTPALRGGAEPSSGERGCPPDCKPAIRSRASAGTFSVVFERPRPVAPRGMGGSIGSFPAAGKTGQILSRRESDGKNETDLAEGLSRICSTLAQHLRPY
jgi:hypothetical protein